MIFNEEFLTTLRDKTVSELEENIRTIEDMIVVIKRLREFKIAKASWEAKNQKECCK